MRLAVISDGVSQDPSALTVFCRRFRHPVDIELRSITFCGQECKSPFLIDDQTAEELKTLFGACGISVIGLASPLLKCGWDDEVTISEHLAGFRRCLKLCDIFGCRLVRGFAFWSKGLNEEGLRQARDKAADLFRDYLLPDAEEAGVILGLENEGTTVLATANETVQFVREINSPNLRIVWDPANEAHAEDGIRPFPDAWELVKPYMVHVHAKDVWPGGPDGEIVSYELGKGIIDWGGQIRKLIEMGYEGHISLETHWRMGEEQLPKAVTAQPGGADFTTLAAEASSHLCMLNLFQMIKEARSWLELSSFNP